MFYPRKELEKMGFNRLGENVLIDTRTQIDNPRDISLGNNVKIGSYVILTGKIQIGNYTNICAFSALYGQENIQIDDFVAISGYVRLLTDSDDYSGESLSAPFIDEKYKNILKGKIHIKRHCIVGNGALILPNVTMGEGVSLGAMSMLKCNAKEWGIYAGIPAKRIKERKKDMLKFEKEIIGE